MVYGAINEKGEAYYTYLKKLFDAINNKKTEYNWLITDCICYPDIDSEQAYLEGTTIKILGMEVFNNVK